MFLSIFFNLQFQFIYFKNIVLMHFFPLSELHKCFNGATQLTLQFLFLFFNERNVIDYLKRGDRKHHTDRTVLEVFMNILFQNEMTPYVHHLGAAVTCNLPLTGSLCVGVDRSCVGPQQSAVISSQVVSDPPELVLSTLSLSARLVLWLAQGGLSLAAGGHPEQVALLGAEIAARRDNVNGDEAERSASQ